VTETQIWWGLGLSVLGTVLVLVFEALIGKPVRGGVRSFRRRALESQLALLELTRSRDATVIQMLMLRSISDMLVGLGFLGYAIFLLVIHPSFTVTFTVFTLINLLIFLAAGIFSGHGLGKLHSAATNASIYWDALTAADDRKRALEEKIRRLSK
jgi:hypothetical protein